MNIFFLSADPVQCAVYHTDKHVVKMIVEYAQLMSTAHRLIDGKLGQGFTKSGRKKKTWALPDYRDSVLYAPTHVNHPSAVWVRKSSANYKWLFNLWTELLAEYTYRYGKIHKSSGLMQALSTLPNNIASGDFTEPAKAMPTEYAIGDAITAYRSYYIGEKSHMFNWKKRTTPEWVAAQFT